MPPNVFKIRETGDIATFRGGKPLILQLGSLSSQVPGENLGQKLPGIHDLIKQQTGIDYGSLPTFSVEDAVKQFIPGAHPNAFFDLAQTGSLQDFITGGEPIKMLTPQETQQAFQQRLEERRSYEAGQTAGIQQPLTGFDPNRMRILPDKGMVSGQPLQGQFETLPDGRRIQITPDRGMVGEQPYKPSGGAQMGFDIDPRVQKAQQEIQQIAKQTAELSKKRGVSLIPEFQRQFPQTFPIAPQTQQNALGTTKTPETTPYTSQGLQNAPQAPEPSLTDEIKGIFSQLGISLPPATQSPVSSAADVYKQFVDQTNLFGIKKDLKELVNKKTQEIADVNENPFISEGLRQKKIANIENKYQARIDALQSTFNRADEDARFLTGKYLEQVHQTQQRTDDFLFKAIDLAEKEISGRRAEIREAEREREFRIRERERERQFEERERFVESRFERTLQERAKKEQKVSDKDLNKKIQHIFDAKKRGESADDLKKEIDEAEIENSMKDLLKIKVDNIYGIKSGQQQEGFWKAIKNLF